MRISAGIAASMCLAGVIAATGLLDSSGTLSAAGAVPLPDAGRNVAQATKLNSGLKGFPANFHMIGARQGWGITLQGIWRTADGAVSWKHPLSNIVPMPGDEFLISGIAQYFPDSSNGWVISAYGPQKPLFVFHTADQGQSWQAARLPVKVDWEQGYSGGLLIFRNGREDIYY